MGLKKFTMRAGKTEDGFEALLSLESGNVGTLECGERGLSLEAGSGDEIDNLEEVDTVPRRAFAG